MSALVTVRAFLNPVEVRIVVGDEAEAARVVPAKAVRNFNVRPGQRVEVREL